jgi:DNA-binding transcriptional regulator PaaX
VKVRRNRITIRGLLRLLNDLGDEWEWIYKRKGMGMIDSDSGFVKNLEYYFPSVVEKTINGLYRKGWVEKVETSEGIRVRITERGRHNVLIFNLEKLVPKTGIWDGKWRVVFFDIEEIHRNKRWQLRRYLKKLGLRQMQESVWIGPYDVRDEVKYLREVLEIPHNVKMGLLLEVENSDDLKKWFGLD